MKTSKHAAAVESAVGSLNQEVSEAMSLFNILQCIIWVRFEKKDLVRRLPYRCDDKRNSITRHGGHNSGSERSGAEVKG
jgi:hypothetical protein